MIDHTDHAEPMGPSDLEDSAMLMAEDDSQPPYRTSGWQPAAAPQPLTEPLTDAEWADRVRWAIQPVGTRRGAWVAREAQAIFRARTGRGDPWPSLEDYAAADAVIPAEIS